MDMIYEWLRNVAVFFILMTAVLNVLPDEKYRKYVQFFLGLVMLIVLCRPILAIGNLDGVLKETLRKLTLEEEVRGMEQSRIRVEGIQKEALYQGYEKEISGQVSDYLEGMGVVPVRVDVSIGEKEGEEPEVERIEVLIRKTEEQDADISRKIKKELCGVYQISEAHMIVKLQE